MSLPESTISFAPFVRRANALALASLLVVACGEDEAPLTERSGRPAPPPTEVVDLSGSLVSPVVLPDESSGPWSAPERLAHYGVPAAAVAGASPTHELSHAWGTTGVDGGSTVEVSTAFAAGGLTQLMMALGALSLQQDRTVHLDQPASELLVSFQLRSASYRSPTLLEVLSHNAGLGLPRVERRSDGAALVSLDGRRGDRLEIVEQPGMRQVTSEGGAVLVEQLLLDITGKAELKDVLEERVFEPFGMKRTRLETPHGGVAAGHTASGEAYSHLAFPLSLAGLVTTVEDLSSLAEGLCGAMRGDRDAPLRRAVLQEALRPRVGGRSILGPVRDRGEDAHVEIVTLEQGVATMFVFYPSPCRWLVGLANGARGASLLREVAAAASAPLGLTHYAPETIDVQPMSWARAVELVGTFTNHRGGEIRVSTDGSALEMSARNVFDGVASVSHQLYAVAAERFVIAESGELVTFSWTPGESSASTIEVGSFRGARRGAEVAEGAPPQPPEAEPAAERDAPSRLVEIPNQTRRGNTPLPEERAGDVPDERAPPGTVARAESDEPPRR